MRCEICGGLVGPPDHDEAGDCLPQSATAIMQEIPGFSKVEEGETPNGFAFAIFERDDAAASGETREVSVAEVVADYMRTGGCRVSDLGWG